MSSYTLPPVRQVVVSNVENELRLPDDTEPKVEVTSAEVQSVELFGGVMKRAVIGTSELPAKNDGP